MTWTAELAERFGGRASSPGRSIWAEITEMADAHEQPGVFTPMIGFEWTSMPQGDNLHRVVVYADDGEKARQKIPVSAFDGERPEDLWAFMQAYEDESGGRILAIPVPVIGERIVGLKGVLLKGDGRG